MAKIDQYDEAVIMVDYVAFLLLLLLLLAIDYGASMFLEENTN